MAIVSKETLKGYFNDGDVPTEPNYIDLIDTLWSEPISFEYLEIDNVSAGDPAVIFAISGTPKWTIGVDNSDGDIFKIHNSGTLVDDSLLELDTSGTLKIVELIINESISADPRVIFAIAGSSVWTAGVDNSDGDVFKIHNSDYLPDDSLLKLGSGGLRIKGIIEIDNLTDWDPKVTFGVAGVPKWTIGDDTSDSDAFKINSGGGLADDSLFELNTNGDLTLGGGLTLTDDLIVGGDIDLEGVLDIDSLTTADPIVTFEISSVPKWTLGVDNSDDDIFKIHDAGSLGDNSLFELDTAGNLRIDGTYDVYRSATKYTGYVLVEADHEKFTGTNYTVTTTTGTVVTASPAAPTGKIFITACATCQCQAYTTGNNFMIYLYVGNVLRQSIPWSPKHQWDWITQTLNWSGSYTVGDTIELKASKASSDNTYVVSVNYTAISYACYA